METATAATSAAAGPRAADRLRELAANLNLHRGFADVVASLEAGHGGTLGGVWGSSRALLAAALSQSCPGPLVVVAPHPGEIDAIARDLTLFSDLPVATFPAWEAEPGERVVHDETCGERLRVLKALAGDCPLFSTQRIALRKDVEREKGTVPLAARVGEAEGDRPLFSGDVDAGAKLADGKKGTVPVIVTSIQSLLQPVPGRDALAAATREIRVGSQLNEQEIARWLVERGAHATSAVELPGEFSVRGGILDVFAPDADDPVRIELFGDEVESIRRFDVATQRSLETLQATTITMLSPTASDRAHFTSYVPVGAWFMLIEPNELAEEGRFFLERMDRPQGFHAVRTTLEEIYKYPSVTAAGVPSGSMETTGHLEFESVERFSGDIAKVREEVDRVSEGHDVFIVCETEAEVERLAELFKTSKLLGGWGNPPDDSAQSGALPQPPRSRLHFVVGHLEAGFRVVPQRVVLVSAGELFQRHDLARTTRRRQARAIDTFLELREGDLVVHVAHGIGRYRGLRLLEKEGRSDEHLELEYHGGTKIYVPSSKIELVQKYVGGRGSGQVSLAHIGGKAWVKQKEAAERAVTDLAADMIELQAARDARPGISFPHDTEWQREFDAAFPYQETPDQLRAIDEIKRDMQITRPMDRLLCGDVGFGKTELAIRAAFKAVDAGYQVAVLVPTTVLAEQHRRTFSARMAEFPFQIAALSRFCTAKEQREIIKKAATGSLDILVGTHRLASSDVRFLNLGLLIIDEEQRFGVEIKERLKALRTTVDVLTMTATPIPRTLHMSLLGVRAISNLETPPADRLAVETRVTRFSDQLVRHAIMRELNRGGQIYFVHNRINDIKIVAHKLSGIVPEARIDIGHGQMPEHQLEEVMLRFVRGETDILLSTTIVESGLDIPNANTIFIDDADRYGLADLHQLRGRVGRYKHRAYCYLLVGEDRHLSPEAARRLRAIEEFSQMGAGFALAMRDLELRGAGNILGTEQSGHIAMVGYEMYCALLERAVRQLKNMAPRESVDVNIDLPGEAYLPRGYVPDQRSKIDLYRRLARLTTEESVDDFAGELADRFGPLPPVTAHLLELARLRIWAYRAGIQEIRIEDRFVVFGYTSRDKLARVVDRSRGRLRVADRTSAYLPLAPGIVEPAVLFTDVKSLLRPV